MKKRSARAPFVVAIGGLDPSGGAGIVADARSIAAMGAMPLVVATALTVQAGRGVRSSAPVAPARVLAQLDELVRELPVAAIKIGQVPTAATARALAGRLERLGVPVVLDPVLRASGGGELAAASAKDAIAKLLVPLAALVTVNLDEASAFTGARVRSVAGMRRAADALLEAGAGAVLVKGGHLRGDPVDLFADGKRAVELRSARMNTTMHGTGCALASAAAARLAFGDDAGRAVLAARFHVRSLLRATITEGRIRLRPPA